jgi:hypothetical protein
MIKNLAIICFLGCTFIGCNASKNKTNQGPTTEVEKEMKTKYEGEYFGPYSILDNNFGTKTNVTIEGKNRVMTTNAIPNHKTGTFPNKGNPNKISAQNLKYSFPLNPINIGQAKWARELGVALNGVKFEPETAERFICETGEVYKIEAFQKLVDLGLDYNNAHVQPTGAYHYHGKPVGLIESLDKGEDLIHVGFAHDGFPIYYSKSNAYKPSFRLSNKVRTGDICSYTSPTDQMKKELKQTNPDGTFVSDWEYVKGLGQLDECNGTTVNGKYMYFVTDDYPYAGRCLKGEFNEDRPKGPPPGGRPPGGPGGRPPGGKPEGHGHPH